MPWLRLRSDATLRVAAGDRLVDISDALPEPVLRVACRSANCGICRLRVVAGARALSPADARETSVLQQHGARRDERLGCQIAFAPEPAHDETIVVLERLP